MNIIRCKYLQINSVTVQQLFESALSDIVPPPSEITCRPNCRYSIGEKINLLTPKTEAHTQSKALSRPPRKRHFGHRLQFILCYHEIYLTSLKVFIYTL